MTRPKKRVMPKGGRLLQTEILELVGRVEARLARIKHDADDPVLVEGHVELAEGPIARLRLLLHTTYEQLLEREAEPESDLAAQFAALRAEIAALKAEIAALKAEPPGPRLVRKDEATRAG